VKKVYIAVASGVTSAQLRLYEDEGASASLVWSKMKRSSTHGCDAQP
jgi:hypothetical protein